jgi:NADH-quinone oxidoreductase subunit N
MVMVSAGSLLTVYLGVELLSLSLYAMVAFDRESGVAAESAMKYFVLGANLLGHAAVRLLDRLRRDRHAAARRAGGRTCAKSARRTSAWSSASRSSSSASRSSSARCRSTCGCRTSITARPTPVTLFIGSAPKIASFVLAIRVLAEGLDAMVASWQDMLIALAVLSMLIGNVVAIAQTNLKRMLAYSTISHVGFILLGILSGTNEGYRASMYYTLAYVITTVGSFGMILLLSRSRFEADRLEDFKGLNRRSPWFAAIMMMLMFSTAGVPPFIGFWAKLAVIGAVLDVGLAWLAAVAVVLSVVAAFYYLRVVKLMYFDDPTDSHAIEAGGTLRAVLSANGVAVLALGVFPPY